jgi:hypothetical protein
MDNNLLGRLLNCQCMDTGLAPPTVDYRLGVMYGDYPYEGIHIMKHVGRYSTESYDLRCSDRAGYLGLQSIGLVPCDE